MAVRKIPDDAPEEFAHALAQIRSAILRPEVIIEEVPAPQRIAPYAAAFSADVVLDDVELGTGRFVLLHDATQLDTWDGRFRAVTFARATLEDELGTDPMLAQVGWSWLQESLQAYDAEFTAEGGTVTRVSSDSFGALADRPSTVELEVRASWTPLGSIGRHFEAWGALLATVAGLPPLPAGVSALPRRQR